MSAASRRVGKNAPVPSPCINLCVIDPASGFCEGCGRSMAEIGRWPTLPEEERRRINKLLGRRIKALRQRLAGELD